MLRFSEESSALILKGFECGICAMDDFIQNSLEPFLQSDQRYRLNVVTDNGLGIVAMFVTSPGVFVSYEDGFEDLPQGKPWSYLDEDFQIQTGSMYPTLEIDYLAVREDVRGRGYGTCVIAELSNRARESGCFFLTVDAYHVKGYSAIPFYEKQGFFALQELSEDYDTLRMALRV